MTATTLSRPAALLCLAATQAALFAGLAWLAVAGRLSTESLVAAVALATAALAALVLQLYRQQAAERHASAVKSAFLAQMNHELRTPLSGVFANLELLRGSELTREQRDLVEGCMHAGKGLLGVIGNSLDLSRIEAGRLTLAPAEFDLREMLDSVASIYRSAAQEGETHYSRIRPGMILKDNLYSSSGRLIVAAGLELSEDMVKRLVGICEANPALHYLNVAEPRKAQAPSS